MLEKHQDYAATVARFHWNIPQRYNIGVDVCDRWAQAEPDRLALIDAPEGGAVTHYSYGALRAGSNRLANALAALGLGRGAGLPPRVGVMLPQRVETALAHIAVTKLGCISIPLFTLFGPEALLHRLRHSGARVVITDAAGAEKLASLRGELPGLTHVISVDGAAPGVLDFAALCAAASDQFTPVDTLADDPALLIYTSGTTGNPKGALHAHRVLLGHMPGVEISHD
ncbi:MAG: AMP-binding protein, partial [Pseudorhodobacter sp.]|nr:AMP-binding protein [Pseudorhodobacter sp.]